MDEIFGSNVLKFVVEDPSANDLKTLCFKPFTSAEEFVHFLLFGCYFLGWNGIVSILPGFTVVIHVCRLRI